MLTRFEPELEFAYSISMMFLKALNSIILLLALTVSAKGQAAPNLHYRMSSNCDSYMNVRKHFSKHPEWIIFLAQGDQKKIKQIFDEYGAINFKEIIDNNTNVYSFTVKAALVRQGLSMFEQYILSSIDETYTLRTNMKAGGYAAAQIAKLKKYGEILGVSVEKIEKANAVLSRQGVTKAMNFVGKGISIGTFAYMLASQYSCSAPEAQTYTYRPPQNPWSGQINFYKSTELLFSDKVSLEVACLYSRKGVLNDLMIALDHVFTILETLRPDVQAQVVSLALTKKTEDIIQILEFAKMASETK